MAGVIAQIMGIPRPAVLSKPSFKFWTGGYDLNYNSQLGVFVSQLLLYAIVVGGIIFFIKLLIAGFGLLTSAGDPAKIQSATKGLTNAVVGLLIVFSAFFISQILQTILGINIL